MKRTPLKPMSKRRAKELAEYRVRRKAFLDAHPYCEAWGIIWPSLTKHTPRSTEIHHLSGRIGKKLNDESMWLAVGREAHNFIHQNPKTARSLKLLQ